MLNAGVGVSFSATVTPGSVLAAVPDGDGNGVVGCELPVTAGGGAGSNVGPDVAPAAGGGPADCAPTAASTIPGGDEDEPFGSAAGLLDDGVGLAPIVDTAGGGALAPGSSGTTVATAAAATAK